MLKIIQDLLTTHPRITGLALGVALHPLFTVLIVGR